jgi:Fe-S cluster assembly iron-binding protein IscA
MVLDEPGENEQAVKINGIDILIDEYERNFIDGTVIDYVKEARGEGFIINSGSTC